jgi:hypothetical protein
MLIFRFTVGQAVKVQGTDEIGTVVRCDTEPTLQIPFYEVKFEDGSTRRIAESRLLPA